MTGGGEIYFNKADRPVLGWGGGRGVVWARPSLVLGWGGGVVWARASPVLGVALESDQ